MRVAVDGMANAYDVDNTADVIDHVFIFWTVWKLSYIDIHLQGHIPFH